MRRSARATKISFGISVRVGWVLRRHQGAAQSSRTLVARGGSSWCQLSDGGPASL